MANVPTYQPGSVAPAQATTERVQAADFGPGIGKGVEQLGQSLDDASKFAAQIGALHDEATVKEQARGVEQGNLERLYTGPNALFAKKGKDALETVPFVQKALTADVQQRRALLQNDRQRTLFDQAIQPQVMEWQKQIATHAISETQTYFGSESLARAGIAGESAGHVYADNPQLGEQHLATMRAEIASAGKAQGWGEAQVAQRQIKDTSAVYHDIALNLIRDGGAQGPDLGRKFVELHKGSITDDDARTILDHADSEQKTQEAEARRLEAEARRQQSEEKRDARARVETGIVQIEESHQPLSADEFGSVLKDAQTTGDVNLVRRVHDMQFKNGLAVQYNGVPPIEIQNDVNTLSAKITKAGTKADPEDILKRDYLQGLYNSSKAQLDSNGIAWAAKNLGTPVQPLNIADPNSIATRASQVAQASAKAGHPIAPLQPEEVAQLAPVWKQGDVQHKVRLATQIAKFGAMAGNVAQQIAPGDNGFANLIGLASHANPSVAASRVNQIVTGYEAIKTKPKLINAGEAIPLFNQYVGQALQFLPGVKDGVYTNAKALLAAHANEAGINEWSEVDPRDWKGAVNSALGAYVKDGKQYGGITAFNGANTVLPENMTQDDFEGRISRSHGPEFRQAQNGVPTLGNGQHPTADDIKKMQWVPSDDGVYRLSDGHSFLHTDKGGFYEIDVRKLPSDFNSQLASHGYVRR